MCLSFHQPPYIDSELLTVCCVGTVIGQLTPEDGFLAEAFKKRLVIRSAKVYTLYYMYTLYYTTIYKIYLYVLQSIKLKFKNNLISV